MLNRRCFLGGFAALPFAATPALAGTACVFRTQGVAIGGIDPVSYFVDARPIPGTNRHRLMWRKAIWQFASSATMEAFERNPRHYAPRYGGFCALTMARGALSATVPEAWVVYQGRLYLTKSPAAIEAWQSNPAAHIAKADVNWSTGMCG